MRNKFIAVFMALALQGMVSITYADSSNKITVRNRVNLHVGERIVIHGLRGECGKLPTSENIAAIGKRFENVKLGKVVAGNEGVRFSGRCKGYTPVIEAVFIAERAGRMNLKLFGDNIFIRVK